ncbi:hypothetical protein [Bacillus toyonensis]|uniref:hypothetical protein n=1 Tax=Bacillus toyonensis TaxID=155322 RepID=UPI000BF9D7BC|nr:hypothetical protein [Bacillus toyonensis]PGF05273.1 hypothetical protein COM61_02355 [Bacillus toyonensis]
MKSFRISDGTYGDYTFITLLTDKDLSKQEFITMYNQVVLEGRNLNREQIADELCKRFGFVRETHFFEIHGMSGFGIVQKYKQEDVERDDLKRIEVYSPY